jgi:regulator of replication initiation timing
MIKFHQSNEITQLIDSNHILNHENSQLKEDLSLSSSSVQSLTTENNQLKEINSSQIQKYSDLTKKIKNQLKQ